MQCIITWYKSLNSNANFSQVGKTLKIVKKIFFGYILLILLHLSCGNDSESLVWNDLKPSNLSAAGIAVGTDSNNLHVNVSGVADFKITATNAALYKVIINNEELEFTQNTSGYTFTNSGTNECAIAIMASNSAGYVTLHIR